MNRVIGIGETVYDIIFKNERPVSATPGGSAFNALISVGRMGINCAMITNVGDDNIGDITLRYMEDNGVDTSLAFRQNGMKSHVALAFLDENDNAQYQFYKDHAGVDMPAMDINFTDADAVLFGSFFAINPGIRDITRALLTKAKQRGAFLYYDINFRASHIADIPSTLGNINENMSLSSVVRGSLEDFGYLYGTENIDEIYEKHIRPYCPYFICSDGGNPVQLRTPLFSLSFDAPKIKTVSTVGAGDNFNAGFLCQLMEEKNISSLPIAEWEENDWEKLIANGQKFSAIVCQSLGNSIPSQKP
ncbi:MAG: carbohydrate kinase [Prevotella sp.]|nr:carbohydrate kinase [Prevotella sp.]